jgi:hypothetical protein
MQHQVHELVREDAPQDVAHGADEPVDLELAADRCPQPVQEVDPVGGVGVTRRQLGLAAGAHGTAFAPCERVDGSPGLALQATVARAGGGGSYATPADRVVVRPAQGYSRTPGQEDRAA